MKKQYFCPECEIVKLEENDVITTSDQESEAPGADFENPFGGGYDKNGWT